MNHGQSNKQNKKYYYHTSPLTLTSQPTQTRVKKRRSLFAEKVSRSRSRMDNFKQQYKYIICAFIFRVICFICKQQEQMKIIITRHSSPPRFANLTVRPPPRSAAAERTKRGSERRADSRHSASHCVRTRLRWHLQRERPTSTRYSAALRLSRTQRETSVVSARARWILELWSWQGNASSNLCLTA